MNNQKQSELCKKCIASEYIEFTDNKDNYYFCHQANTRIDNIEFDKECQCFEEV